MRILVVDDNDDNRKILRVIFSAHGHEIEERANGLEGLDALHATKFDALITDVLMPGMDGYRLCSEIRRSERTRDIPIIVYSSIYTSAADEKVALAAGADRFVSKPASGKALLEALRDVCGSSRDPIEESPPTPEPEVLKTYSEKLVTRLKEKSQELDLARIRLAAGNENLRQANVALEKDVSESKRRGEEVEHLAFHDPLTGLPNRLLFNDRLNVALSQVRRHGGNLATLFMDVDNFKSINDTRGHAAGDELLRLIADRLRTCIRQEDTLARFGGDEFVLLVTGIVSEGDASRVSEKILEAIRAPFQLEGRVLFVTLSVGASVFPMDGHGAEALVKNADIAMYRSKQQGRNRYQLFSQGARDDSPAWPKHEALRNALHSKELVLHYQPIVDLCSGEVRGVEALLRWQIEGGRLLPPLDFIPLAETSDLAISICQWVLKSACAQTVTWQKEARPRLTVAVNLSTRAFQQPDLVGEVSKALAEAGLSPDCLDLEITESSARQDIVYSASVLGRLKDMGVHVSLDDFGTGTSSLSYLKRLPIDRIKIDQSIVQNAPHDPDDAAMVAAVVATAHRMKHTAMAEGVETREQLSFLRDEKCDQAQGFLFSRPLPPSAVPRAFTGSPDRASAFPHLFAAQGGAR